MNNTIINIDFRIYFYYWYLSKYKLKDNFSINQILSILKQKKYMFRDNFMLSQKKIGFPAYFISIIHDILYYKKLSTLFVCSEFKYKFIIFSLLILSALSEIFENFIFPIISN